MRGKIKSFAASQTQLLLILLLAFSTLAPLIKIRTASAAAPPKDPITFTLLAAGERIHVTAGTPDGVTENNNGSEWYYRTGRAMGFAAGGDTVDLVGGSNADRGTTNANKRLSWHVDSSSMYSGYRAGETVVDDDSFTRYVYQANSLPSYYPSGPQTNISESSLTGWTQCWSGSYGDSKDLNALFNTDCTGSYLLYAASPSVNNYIDVTKDEASVLAAVGNQQNNFTKLFAGDTLHFGLYKQDKTTAVSWDDYVVYKSTCVVSSSCWPNNPLDSQGNWDSGTHVTNGMYTIPEDAENEQLYIFQADDSTGARVPNTNAINLSVEHTPVENLITTCEELAAIDDNTSNKETEDTYMLANDIDCSSIENFEPLNFDGYFEGTFDGQGHTISNLTINYPEDEDVGLFTGLDGATVKDVTLSGGSVNAYAYGGAVAGEAYSSSLSNIHSDLDITGEVDEGYNMGGLIGYADIERSVTLTGLSSTGDVTGDEAAIGGLFGEIDINGQTYAPTIVLLEESYATGNVTSGSGYAVGGLIGYVYVSNDNGDNMPPAGLTLRNTYAQGDVDAVNGTEAGGLIGYMEVNNSGSGSEAAVTIEKSYASGVVSANDDPGGLIGFVDQLSNEGENLSISDSFAVGLVDARGGSSYALIGNEYFADEAGVLTLDNVYFDETGTNQSYPAYAESNDWYAVNGDGEDPAYFKNNSTNPPLDQWDFEDIWVANENDYPTFRATPITDDSANLTSAENGTKITLEQTGCDAIENTSTNKESGLTVQDAAFSYPLGFVGFHLTGCDNGGTATVTVTFTGTFNPSAVVARKYNPNTNSFTTITGATKSTTTLDGNQALQITYTITDGGELDQDGTANGTIVDPVGLAVQSVGSPNTGLLRKVL